MVQQDVVQLEVSVYYTCAIMDDYWTTLEVVLSHRTRTIFQHLYNQIIMTQNLVLDIQSKATFCLHVFLGLTGSLSLVMAAPANLTAARSCSWLIYCIIHSSLAGCKCPFKINSIFFFVIFLICWKKRSAKVQKASKLSQGPTKKKPHFLLSYLSGHL